MRSRSIPVLCLAVCLALPGTTFAQNKISGDVIADLEKTGRSRVIVVMKRPLGDLPETFAFSKPTAYLATVLSGQIDLAAPFKQAPAAVAEIGGEAVAKLREDENVALVVKDKLSSAFLFESVDLVKGQVVWNNGSDGTGQVVAILDTGVDLDHPFLANKIVDEACFSTVSSSLYRLSSLCPNGLAISVKKGSGNACDGKISGCDHGTHVAGIVAGAGGAHGGNSFDGVARGANLIAIQVFTRFEDPRVCGSSAPCVRSFTSDQLRALEHVRTLSAKHKIASVNMSLGGGRHESSCDSTSPLTTIIEDLARRKIATVIASGNDGYFDAVSEPACVSAAIAVGSVDKTSALAIDYSNTSKDIDFVAPGSTILSSVLESTYKMKSGTSMATPHVAGAWAVLKSKYPEAAVAQIESALKEAGASVIDPRSDLSLVLVDLERAIGKVDMASTAPASDTSEANGMKDLPVGAKRVIIVPDPSGPASTYSDFRLKGNLEQIFKSQQKLDISNGKVVVESASGFSRIELESAVKVLGTKTQIFEDKLAKPM